MKTSSFFSHAQGREDISRGVDSELSIREVARKIARSLSTVSHKINRNGGTLRYRAISVNEHVLNLALRSKQCKLQKYRPVSNLVKSMVSDQQKMGFLKV